jgi:hypothetical protein
MPRAGGHATIGIRFTRAGRRRVVARKTGGGVASTTVRVRLDGSRPG